MKCFNHPDVDAVGLCSACNRGVCPSCAADVRRGLACKDRCEHEVRRLLDLRDFSFTQPHYQNDAMRRMTAGRIRAVAINLGLCITFLVVWYLYRQVVFAGLAGGTLFIALLTLSTGRPRIRTDQFRLCPKCGYNVTGNTAGQCPECGYRV